MRPVALIAASLLLLPAARGQQPAPVADDLQRIENTLAYRIEQARKLRADGELRRADALYQDVLAAFEAADPLAAQAWLQAAALKAELGQRDRAVALYLDLLDRFGHIPWAVAEASARLEALGLDEPAAVPPAEKTAATRLAIRSKEISLDFEQATLARVQALFQQACQVPLDIDPALAERQLTLRAEKIAVYDALALIAGKLGARLEPTARGYRLLAATRPVERLAAAPADDMTRRGELSREEIVTVVRANLAAVQACYEKHLETDPELAGKMDIRWTIDRRGEVRRAEVQASSMQSPEVGRCICREIESWKFPQPRGDGEVRVTYPFVFASVGF